MKRKLTIAILMFLTLFILACGAGAAATPTPNLQATMEAAIAQTKAAQQAAQPAQPVQPEQPSQPLVDMQATVDAQVQATMAAQQAAQPADQPAPEQPAAEQPAPEQPAPEQPSGDTAATAQAQPMYEFVNTMVDKANLWSAEGIYHDFGSFDKRDSNPSEEYSFSYWFSDNQDYDSYVIRTTINWRAPNSGDPVDLGCGFIWGYSGDDNWHATHLDIEGTVHTYRQRGSGENIEMQGGHYPGGLGTLSGEAEMVITVEDDLYTVFINNMQVVRFRDPYIATGKVGPAIFYGEAVGAMQCTMDQIEFWELK